MSKIAAVPLSPDQASATRSTGILPQFDTRSGRKPVLISVYGPTPGTVYPIDSELVIGRADDASITVQDERVSRHHTRVVVRGPESVFVEDLESKNGTWVNGKRVTSVELQNGDTLQIGNETVFHFVFRDPVEQRLQERQKLEAIGRLAGGVAHEFNNLLSIVLGNLTQLQRELFTSDAATEVQQSMLRDAIGAAGRATEMTHQLLGLARRARPSDAPVNVSALVEDLGRLVGRTLVRDIAVELDVAPGLYIRGEAPELQQALLNLCINARDAMTTGGILTLRLRPLAADDPRRVRDGIRGEFVELQVEDTGVGMDAETLKHMFEPFFTTKEFKDGTGLGMAIVHGIVRGQGGYIDVQSAVGQGTTISLFMPSAAPPGRMTPPPASESEPPLAPGRLILLCEDDEALRRSVTRMLEHLGQRVLAVADGVEAVELFRGHGEQIDLVLLDVSMPRQGGAQTFAALRKLAPEVKVLLSSGYHGDHLEPALRAGVQGFLSKPYTLSQLIAALRAIP